MYTSEFDHLLTPEDGHRLGIRSLRPEDGPILARFFASLSGKSRGHFRPHTFTTAGAEEVVREAAGPYGIYFLVLAEDNEPTGYGFLIHLQRQFPTLGIAVADAWQNRGIGKALMRFLVEVAERLGKNGVDLTVDDDNPRAIHVYEATGFELIRKIREMRLTFPASEPDRRGKEIGATLGHASP